jgi:hypothetical protein
MRNPTIFSPSNGQVVYFVETEIPYVIKTVMV